VTAGFIRKDATMRSKLLIAALASAVAGCTTTTADQPDRGVAAVNVPVVVTTDYVFDVAVSGGSLAPNEANRLDAWFQTLGLHYGDEVYVDGSGERLAKAQVARVAGQYGMLVEDGARVTSVPIAPGTVRVVVARHRAEVPGCPNWSTPSQPNFNNRMMSNFGCAVNADLAMQVANPEDLIHGREGPSAIDAVTGAKAILLYRGWPLTAVIEGQKQRPLIEVNTRKDSQ
jgi:pilus assembly protein CpaD